MYRTAEAQIIGESAPSNPYIYRDYRVGQKTDCSFKVCNSRIC